MATKTKPAAQTTCAHHWIIDPPDGPVSSGECRNCGAVKNFQNWTPKKAGTLPLPSKEEIEHRKLKEYAHIPFGQRKGNTL